MILFIIESPPLQKKKERRSITVLYKMEILHYVLLSVIDDHFFFLFHFSRRLKRRAQLSRS